MTFALRSVLALAVVFSAANLSMAADDPAPTTTTVAPVAAAEAPNFGKGIGMGLSILGLGLGLGLIGFSALSGVARQPEQAGKIQGLTILLAALVEGAAIISLILCFVI